MTSPRVQQRVFRGMCGLSVAACLTCTPARADFEEDFDGVLAPNLPVGWRATNAVGPDPTWVSTVSNSDSLPNNAFVNDPSAVSDKRLETPSIPIATVPAVLRFRNRFSLDDGFDGGVLEISIDGAAFQDILSAGGVFVEGGYNRTIDANQGNPIAGRQAWSGSSGGYLTTTVNLPASAAGKDIVLRFRMGSDGVFGDSGWHVDSVEVGTQDSDSDGLVDILDNCTNASNAGQEDADSDGIGDACDNCPGVDTVDQTNTDGDFFGNACDNCPDVFNNDGFDADTDGRGDVCDGCPNDAGKFDPGACGCGVAETDTDGDGTPDCIDECPENPDLIAPQGCGGCGGACGMGMAVSTPVTLLALGLGRRRRRPEVLDR